MALSPTKAAVWLVVRKRLRAYLLSRLGGDRAAAVGLVHEATLRQVASAALARLSPADIHALALDCEAVVPGLSDESMQQCWDRQVVAEPAPPVVRAGRGAVEPAAAALSPASLRNAVKNRWLVQHQAALKVEALDTGCDWRSLGCKRFRSVDASCAEYLALLARVRAQHAGGAPSRAVGTNGRWCSRPSEEGEADHLLVVAEVMMVFDFRRAYAGACHEECS